MIKIILRIIQILIIALASFSFGVILGENYAKAATPNLFMEGQQALCMYEGVKSYFDGTQFVETTPIICKVLEASEVYNSLAPNYQHIKVDCTDDINKKSSDKPGFGLVKDHKLNYKVLWLSSKECAHYSPTTVVL